MLRRGVTLFWRAVKANWIPAVGIWTIGALLVWGYYRGGFVYDVALSILSLRQKYGLLYPMCSMALFAAVLPLATQYLLVPKARATVPGRMAWLVPYWAYKGLEINLFYWLQAVVWGDGTGFWTVFAKVFVDQFLYSPTVGDITIILWMRYVARRFGEIPAGTPIAPKGWYQLYLVPVIVANWAVWIPAVTLVYMLPTALQLPLSNLIQWFWSMLLLFMASDPATQPAPKADTSAAK
jgi:hypothetical protein